MKIYEIIEEEQKPWVPRAQVQLSMTAQEIQIDNFCREILQVLNKVTPQNIDVLLDRIGTLSMNKDSYIQKLVYYILRKAEEEPLYSEIYAEMCFTLNQIVDRSVSATHSAENVPPGELYGTFKSMLLVECRICFDKIFTFEEDQYGQNDAFISTSRKKFFSIIMFIGELYNVGFLDQEILFELLSNLLQDDNKSEIMIEIQVECLCKFLCVVGQKIECQERKRQEVERIFEKLNHMNTKYQFCSRVRFLILDTLELRGNKWVARRTVEKPKTLEEIRDSFSNINIKRRKKKKIRN